MVRRSSALFLLKLKEQQRVSQSAINDIVDNCKGLFSQTMERVRASVNAKIADIGLDPEAIDGVFDSVLDPFVTISDKTTLLAVKSILRYR